MYSRRQQRLLAAYCACALAMLASACASSLTLRGGYCAPPIAAAAINAEDAAPAPSARREEHLAALLGVRALLDQPAASRSAEAKQLALERVVRAHLEIAATSAELDCEAERAEQAAAFLARRASSQVQGLTLASIAAATLTGIAGVFLSVAKASGGAQIATGAGGGVVTAALGVASLYVAPSLRFEHPRNLLSDVWRGPATSNTYPPVVWAYFTRPAFSNNQQTAIRAGIVTRWSHVETIARGQDAATLLFGSGGNYDADTLRARAAMLNTIKAEVALEDQDLAALTAALTH